MTICMCESVCVCVMSVSTPQGSSRGVNSGTKPLETTTGSGKDLHLERRRLPPLGLLVQYKEASEMM